MTDTDEYVTKLLEHVEDDIVKSLKICKDCFERQQIKIKPASRVAEAGF